MGSCHLSKACHQVTAGGVGIQIWKVPANILAASKRCGPLTFEMGEGLKTHLKICCEMLHTAMDLDRSC